MLTTNGTLSMAPKPEFSGRLRAASQTLPKLMELIGYPIFKTSPLNRFRLACDAKGNAEGMLFSDLNLRLAGSDFEGSLSIETGDTRPLLSGTLATDLFTLDPFFVHFEPIFGEDGQWTRAPLDFQLLAQADLDLRISAARARLARFEMQDAALSFITHSHRMDVNLAQATTYRGILKARATLIMNQNAVDLRAASSMTGLDVGALSWDLTGLPEVVGSADGSVNIETTGHSVSELVQNLNGRLLLSVNQGDVRGLDIDRILDAKNATQPTAEARSVRIPYEKAQLGVKIQNGMAEVEQGLVNGPAGNLLLSGTAALSDRKFDLRAVILPLIPDDPLSRSSQNHNILIKGQWDHPQISPAAP
jgi:AsmA protein